MNILSALFTGCLEEELVQILVDYLIVGNAEVRLDMLKTLCNSRNISYINKVCYDIPVIITVMTI